MIVIIGCGAAGISALNTLSKLGIKDVLVISSERPYSKPLLLHYLSGKIDRSRIFLDGIKFIQDKVIEVKPNENTVLLKSGKEIKYDQLLIATGAYPIKPKIDGIDLKGVFFLNTLKDADEIMRYLRNVKKAVIIGAGFVGISAAVALRKRNIDVTIVELKDRVLPEALDKDFANIAKEILENNGVKVILGKSVSKIIGDNSVKGVVVENEEIKCDMVITSVGVRPNIEFLRNSGIEIRTGIVVNDKMQTNFKDIYAAGDCAETKDLITGEYTINAVWINASIQGRIAAYNIAGIERTYDGSIRINVIDIFGVPFVSIGYITDDFERLDNKIFYYKGDKIVGFQTIGFEELKGALSIITQKGQISELYIHTSRKLIW